MFKMKISLKYAENVLIFDLLLSNGFKIQTIPIYACPVILYWHGQMKNEILEMFGNLKISFN